MQLIIHDRTIRIWAMNIKNILSFTASRSWVTPFKVVSRKIIHKVSTRVDVDAAAVQTTAADFVHEIKSFIAEHELTPVQVLNTDQFRFDKNFHSGITLVIQGSNPIFVGNRRIHIL